MNIFLQILFILLFMEGSSFGVDPPPGPDYGTPFITNFSPKEYQANGQNWASIQDSNGLLYFANSGGMLLQYDGQRWIKIEVGNGSIVRDIKLDPSGRIFIGMQNDFGYIQSDQTGRQIYHSLRKRVNSLNNKFGDIWKIEINSEWVYFLERKNLFRFSKKELSDSLETIKVIKAKNRFHNIFKGPGNHFFVQQVGVGLMQTSEDSIRLARNGTYFKDDLLAAVLPYTDEQWLVATRARGLFLYAQDGSIKPFKTDCDLLLKNGQLYQARWLKDGNLAIASKYGGLFIISAAGKLLQKIDESVGLANNTVWSVFQDAGQGLWLSLNEGIAFIDYASPFTTFGAHSGLKGSVHNIIRYRGRIYVTTNYGLFLGENMPLVRGRTRFRKLPGINTSGWDMLEAQGMLFISANSGVYVLEGNQARLLFKYDPWGFYQSKQDPHRVFIGLASGVASFYINSSGQLQDEGKIPGINIEARTLAEDAQGNLWLASSYHGVQRADSLLRYFEQKTPPLIRTYEALSGLPTNMSILIFENNKQVLFSTPRGIYKFDVVQNRFLMDSAFKQLNQKKHPDETYTLSVADHSGNVWAHIDQHIVLNRPTDNGSYQLMDSVFRGIPEAEIQCIYPDRQQFVWFGQRNGLYKYDRSKQFPAASGFKPLIRSVVLNHQTNLPDTQSSQYRAGISTIAYSAGNMLRFSYACPFYIQPEKTMYRYQLQRFDQDWSGWTSESQKDYTNLPHGEYTFLVESRNVYGQLNRSEPYSFSILPPWYHTGWAYALFTLIFGALVLFLSRFLMAYSHSKALAEHHRLEEQRRKTEDMIRSQVAADFHDELGTRITRISLFSQILQNDLRDVSDSARSYLGKINKNADRLYDETRDFIWQLDPQKDTLADFIARLKSFGDELFEDTKIDFSLVQNIDKPHEIKLGMDQRRNLIRIIKEALHNALKYAQCKNVSFEISQQAGVITFSVKDDGSGFSTARTSDGIGLQNMKQRARKIQAILQIISQTGKGTQIELSVNL